MCCVFGAVVLIIAALIAKTRIHVSSGCRKCIILNTAECSVFTKCIKGESTLHSADTYCMNGESRLHSADTFCIIIVSLQYHKTKESFTLLTSPCHLSRDRTTKKHFGAEYVSALSLFVQQTVYLFRCK